MRPSVRNVPRFAIASWRIVYAAHRTPASDRAAILMPLASAEIEYASSPGGTRSCASGSVAPERDPPATFGACAPYQSAKWRASHATAPASGHSTVTVAVASNATGLSMSRTNSTGTGSGASSTASGFALLPATADSAKRPARPIAAKPFANLSFIAIAIPFLVVCSLEMFSTGEMIANPPRRDNLLIAKNKYLFRQICTTGRMQFIGHRIRARAFPQVCSFCFSYCVAGSVLA